MREIDRTSASPRQFLVARHLTYYRPEHYPLVFYPTLPELSTLFLASVKLALPEVPIPGNEAISKLRKVLAKHVSPEDKEELVLAAKEFDAHGGRVDLIAWIKCVEETAHRAALVLCGDFHVVMKQIRGETRAIAEVSLEDRRQDLLGYLASNALAEARAKIGIGLRGNSGRSAPPISVRPPA